MERQTRVSVFESDNPAEIQLIKSKLDEAGIVNFRQNAYMTFTTTPTATSLKLQVNLEDEQKAFEIIDLYLKESLLIIPHFNLRKQNSGANLVGI
ncbi:MAG: DUF2007 domain-containing protein [Bergeyella sp.]